MRVRLPADIVTTGWSWDGDQGLTDMSIQTAAQLDIARTLRRLETHLLGLGRDGLHTLIQNAAKQSRRRERARRTKGKKK
jgi:hypothetical protein